MVSVPPWFYGLDLFFDTFSVLAGLIIAILGAKIYYLTKEFRFRDLAVSFSFITAGFLIRILGHIAAYYRSSVLQIISNSIPIITSEPGRPRALYDAGTFLYTFFVLFGLSLLFLITINTLGRRRIFIPFFFILSLLVASFSLTRSYIFHLISSLYLLYISLAFYQNYKSKKTRSSFLVMLSFLLFLISQVLFIFYSKDSFVWLLAESVYLLSFIVLLFTLLMIILRRPRGVQNVRGKKN